MAMAVSRRQWLTSVATLAAAAGCGSAISRDAGAGQPPPLRRANGDVDWEAVRNLFPLAPDWTHLASFLFVSHPRPVAEAIETFRVKMDADPTWIEAAVVTDSEGRPYEAVKAALARYLGGAPDEISLTSNTTSALAIAYNGLSIRPDQHVLTTNHDHYSHHESIRLAAARSGSGVRYIDLYDRPAEAASDEMVARVARAITPSTRAVGVTWVHSSTGVKVPIAGIAEAVAAANRGRDTADRVLLIVDGVHGFGNQDVDVAGLGADFFASGTHKWLFAPRGTGLLWGRRDAWPELRPTIPSFDPDAPETWEAWMNRTPPPPTTAAAVSPGGFLAYEYFLAIPAAVALHEEIGRAAIASRIAELSAAFREGAAGIGGLTLHTPRDPAVSGGLSAFEIDGLSAAEVAAGLAERKIRTNSSPYKVSYARVATGVMNRPDEVDAVLRALRDLAG